MMSRILLAFGIAVCLGAAALVSVPARAAETATSAPEASSAQPWVTDQELAKTVWADIQSGGILGVAPHVADIEKALANAPQSIAAARANKGTSFVLTDGPGDTLLQMAAVTAALQKSGDAVHVVAVENPYPAIGFFLGSYYNEIGKFDDAVRVLDEGLASSGLQGLDIGIGAHLPALLSEKGAALVGLKRFPDALAAYDAALKIDGIDDFMHAHVLRGRGYALTELSRLDEAEQAYNDSLKYEPGNARALSELRYIAGLRSGSRPVAPGGLVSIQPPPVPVTGPPPATATPTSSTPESTSAPTPTPSPTPN
jgi:tetratricopeptide (TPR) repeat protein